MTPQRPNVGDPSLKGDIDPYWLTGFVDGEGCFHVGISKHPELRFKYQILPELTVVQHKRDLSLLYNIRSAMNCGVVRKNHGDRYCWRVRDLKNLAEIVIPFFERYKLKSQKRIEFHKFAKVVRLMQRGDHLEEEGFNRISKLASEMNRCTREEIRIKRESTPE